MAIKLPAKQNRQHKAKAPDQAIGLGQKAQRQKAAEDKTGPDPLGPAGTVALHPATLPAPVLSGKPLHILQNDYISGKLRQERGPHVVAHVARNPQFL